MHSHHDHGGTTESGTGSPAVDRESAELDSPSTGGVNPLAEARRVLAEHEQSQREACAQELGEVLARHGFDLHIPAPQITLVRVGR